jgi:hypothetical protein
MTSTPPKVFISYSHDTVMHQERVLETLLHGPALIAGEGLIG